MRKFLITSITFVLFLSCIGEIVIRVFRLVPDIPERYMDEHGIQRYKTEQSGYYTKSDSKWNVNEYGWLGTHGIKKDSTISIIGDSYIENIMNPIECNQGSILKKCFPNYSFFEAGRSGITFIEAMEISKILEKEIKPKYQLLYLGDNDFYESVSEINRYTDRVQISIKNQKLLKAYLKSPGLKKILYNFKLLYYLYLKFPIFVKQQNKGETINKIQKGEKYDGSIINELFIYCSKNYELNNLIFVLHPNTDNRIIELIKSYGIKTILLNSSNDNSWGFGSHDGHWSCYGHEKAAKQISESLEKVMQ